MSLALALLLATAPAADAPPVKKAPQPSVRLSLRSITRDDAIIRPAAPRSAPHGWVSDADYPVDKLPGEWLVTDVDIDIAVAEDDSVAGCTATVSRVKDRGGAALGEEARAQAETLLAARACRIVRERGGFRHAIDAEGVPHLAKVAMRMSFSAVPVLVRAAARDPQPRPYRTMARPLDATILNFRGDPGQQVDSSRLRAPAAELSIDAEGRVARCRVAVSTGSDNGDAAMCRQLRAAAFEPARDRAGNGLPDGYYFAAMTIGVSSK
ncbi:energy transducer TonB [Sphingopyxis sp. H115]|uniref:energy transducer TonB n=1 Tax=Sphingopyxis sp. H115 TaxID=1759073 RepID=UPI000736866A|nr:hypothetical protein [Sphingopyxis sp. H115]KTE15529.1 hypothetical protein ATE71_07225 [Sphingopyxis sp. H115]